MSVMINLRYFKAFQFSRAKIRGKSIAKREERKATAAAKKEARIEKREATAAAKIAKQEATAAARVVKRDVLPEGISNQSLVDM